MLHLCFPLRCCFIIHPLGAFFELDQHNNCIIFNSKLLLLIRNDKSAQLGYSLCNQQLGLCLSFELKYVCKRHLKDCLLGISVYITHAKWLVYMIWVGGIVWHYNNTSSRSHAKKWKITLSWFAEVGNYVMALISRVLGVNE